MKRNKTDLCSALMLTTLFVIAGTGMAAAQNIQFQELYSFLGYRPSYPQAPPVEGADGNYYGTTSGGGIAGVGTVFKISTNGEWAILHSFTGPDGSGPTAPLTHSTDGNFYGTTYDGGSSNLGTVFRITSDGTLSTLVSFTTNGANPFAGLIQASDGDLYGTTRNGGTNAYGTIFRIGTNGLMTTLVSFDYFTTGANPSSGLVQGSDGNFYGTTKFGGARYGGTIFQLTPGGTLTNLFAFDYYYGTNGSQPTAALVQAADGNFYGTTSGGGSVGYGTVFKITSAGALSTLWSFDGTNGAYPYYALVQGIDGNFYGTTYSGGTNGYGTIFKITAATGALTTLYSFDGHTDNGSPLSGLTQGLDGNLYGTTSANYGSVFKVNPNGALATLTFFQLVNGYSPSAALLQANDGNFYGTTSGGGTNEYGTVFRMTLGGTLSTVATFDALSGGGGPGALVQGRDTNLYGTTVYGGTNGNGAVFKVSASGSLSTVASFSTRTGNNPSGLVQGSDGNFYGTALGGVDGDGTVFKTTPDGVLSRLFYFNGANGSVNPGADPVPFAISPPGLVQGGDGNLYGTMPFGGADDYGTVFKITPSGTLTSLASFDSYVGAYPAAALVLGRDGNFYGTSSGGGDDGFGTVFRMTSSGILTSLVSFDSTNGASALPLTAALLQARDGNYYGTTASGGDNGAGTVFTVTPSGVLTTLISFNTTNGASPSGLIEATDGNLYGTTAYGGSQGGGNIYRISLQATLPTLRISKLGGNVVLSWPIAASNYTLEDKTNLSPASVWLPVSQARITNNNEIAVTIAAPGAAHFYRLRQSN